MEGFHYSVASGNTVYFRESPDVILKLNIVNISLIFNAFK